MDTVSKKTILEELQITGLSAVDKDLGGIDVILALKGRDLSLLSESKLSEYIYTAIQYQLYLQLHYNIRHVEYLKAKRQYDLALNRELITIIGKQTIKEKTATALKKEHLIKLEEEVSTLETKYNLLNKMPEAFLEVANSLKKELSLRPKARKEGNEYSQ